MPLLIVKSPRKMQTLSDSLRSDGKIIGLVPTMGSLHGGHLKLVEIALRKADIVVVSIFVNPAQFGPNEDFRKYPRSLKKDCLKLGAVGANVVFNPSMSAIYPEGFDTYIDPGRTGEILEGARRPGHFRGVATICAKLFNIVKPHFAVFGQKDGQQLAVIRKIARELDFDLEIVKAPIVRTEGGVAMSSRHAYLSASDLKKAEVIKQSLDLAASLIKKGARNAGAIEKQMRSLILSVPDVKIDYISFNRWDDLKELIRLSGEVMISVVVVIAGVRLLDNKIIKI
ncbi:MAG: pantoate--beta-alanine ligase [candidate division Zixibacteria bacterium RBG_16_53_22]|nr:MAG: pantoate--beta-alanine ligase [candidate division Zixibacteria bacterium RBG_16_53_22]